MAAIAMTVNAFKTRALFDGKVETGAATAPVSEQEAPEPAPGRT